MVPRVCPPFARGPWCWVDRGSTRVSTVRVYSEVLVDGCHGFVRGLPPDDPLESDSASDPVEVAADSWRGVGRQTPVRSRNGCPSWPRCQRITGTKTGQQLIDLRGHPGGITGVYGVAFSPDGHWIASSDSSGLVKLWDGSPRKEAE